MPRTAEESRRLSREHWHADHSNLMTLLEWAEAEGFSARDVIRIVERPSRWRAEFAIAHCRMVDRKRRPSSPRLRIAVVGVGSPNVLPLAAGRVAIVPSGRRGA